MQVDRKGVWRERGRETERKKRKKKKKSVERGKKGRRERSFEEAFYVTATEITGTLPHNHRL